MKGKSHFTRVEVERISALINLKLVSSTKKQKRIRDEIRDLGFYWTDFSNERRYDVNDFLSVITIIKEKDMELIKDPLLIQYKKFKPSKILWSKDNFVIALGVTDEGKENLAMRWMHGPEVYDFPRLASGDQAWFMFHVEFMDRIISLCLEDNEIQKWKQSNEVD